MDQQTQYPACFSELRLYALWTDMLQHSPDADSATICHDCLPSYQLAMKRAGRCTNPNAVFKFDEGAVVGRGAKLDVYKSGPKCGEKRPENVRPIRRKQQDSALRLGVDGAALKPQGTDFFARQYQAQLDRMNRYGRNS